jgi:transcriptional regulator
LVYLPPLFAENRSAVLIAHIERHEFGMLVSNGARQGNNPQGDPAELIASQIPFLVARRDGSVLLQGHIARANPQAADLDRGAEVLAIFPGPHAYISPGWYEASPAVPTWNYASVHAYGTARAIGDREWLRDLLDRLSTLHEAREAAPWRMRDLPAAYLESMLGGIVGVEIAVSRLEGKFKLSQNRPASDRPRIVAALERREDENSRDVAALMRQREAAAE